MDFSKISAKQAVTYLVFIVILVYANSLTNQFVWDDSVTIVYNDFIKSWHHLPLFFSKAYLTPFIQKGPYHLVDAHFSSGETSYRPLTTLSYMADYSLWKLNPFGFHLTALLLHLINAILLFLVADAITGRKQAALLAALLFALHPVNSEAVNNISDRKDLLALLFYLLSLAAYIRIGVNAGIKRTVYIALSLISFFLALFSKESAMTLPLIIMAYDKIILNRKEGFLFCLKSRYMGYFAVLAFYVWVRFFFMVNTTIPPVDYPGGNFYSNFLTMARVCAGYIIWIIFPVNIPVSIGPTEHYFVSRSLADPWVIPSIILIAACLFLALKASKNSKEIRFAMLWFLINFLPVCNIFPLPNYAAERYLYLPLAGLFLAVSIVLLKGNEKKAFLWAVAVILAALAALTMAKNTVWKDQVTFLSEVEKRFPDNDLVHMDLGAYDEFNGLLAKAADEYKAALKIKPSYMGYNHLGVTMGNMGRLRESELCLEKALELNPKCVECMVNRGITFARMNRYDEAEKAWANTLQIDPGNKEAKDHLTKLKQPHMTWEYLPNEQFPQN